MGDQGFVRRMIQVPMRSRFVFPGSQDVQSEPNTFVADPGVTIQLATPGCVAAHVRMLFQGYLDYKANPM